MIKLAILGSENSHCCNFASVLAPKDGKKIFEDIELIGVYGDPNEPGVAEGNAAIKEKTACTVFAEDKDAFLDEADAVMVTARNGAHHLKYAENYIKKGIPVWIDKPITRSVDDIKRLVALADEYGAVLSGGSSLEHLETVKKFAALAAENKESICGGHVSAPVNMDNPYGGFWFYTQHLIAMITTVFGIGMKSVRAIKNSKGVNAIYSYGDFAVTAFFGSNYSITLYTVNDVATTEAVSLPADYYMPELKTFYEVIKSGKPDKSRREYIAPVYILDATVKAYETDSEIMIDIPNL